MNKKYYIEAKLNKKDWTLIGVKARHDDALEFAKHHAAEKYPIRVVRVVRTLVLEDKK